MWHILHTHNLLGLVLSCIQSSPIDYQVGGREAICTTPQGNDARRTVLSVTYLYPSIKAVLSAMGTPIQEAMVLTNMLISKMLSIKCN